MDESPEIKDELTEIPPEEIKEEISDISEDIEEAQEEINAGNIPAAQAILNDIQTRLAALENGHMEMAKSLVNKADSNHDHPLPKGVSSLTEALEEIEQEESIPERKSWFYKKIRKGNGD
jgi:hypothetical protein